MPAAAKLVYALHGFLGKGGDWQGVAQNLAADTALFADNLFAPDSASVETFEINTVKMAEDIRRRFTGRSGKKIFLGYSLGGRLGLQLLKHDPELFDHYIFLSTNPGLPDSAVAERQQRRQHDQAWSRKITSQNWLAFLEEWNRQSVFSGSEQEPERMVSDYDLTKLQQALTLWSLAEQPDMSQVVRREQGRITWVAGVRDSKYVQLAQGLSETGSIRDFVRLEGGHRLWLDNPEAVARLIENI